MLVALISVRRFRHSFAVLLAIIGALIEGQSID